MGVISDLAMCQYINVVTHTYCLSFISVVAAIHIVYKYMHMCQLFHIIIMMLCIQATILHVVIQNDPACTEVEPLPSGKAVRSFMWLYL